MVTLMSLDEGAWTSGKTPHELKGMQHVRSQTIIKVGNRTQITLAE